MNVAAKPFRIDHVGSLLRPPALRRARTDWMAGHLRHEALTAIEDQAIREAVVLQERAGLAVITDGEFRRVSWRDGFFESVDGFSAERDPADFEFRLAGGKRQRAAPVPRVIGRLVRRKGIASHEFAFLKTVTDRTPKVTLPAPSVMHFFRGRQAIDPAVYPDVEAFMSDVSRIYREELAELAALGCTYVQFDEVALPILCDEGIRAFLASRGDDVDQTIGLYIDALNAALADRPAGMTVVLHMCRGNVGEGMGSGGYEPIAERAFSEINVDGFLLEYDRAGTGGFDPLRHVPTNKIALLGLISTKQREIESEDYVKARLDEAARHLDLRRAGLCPQCGFASGYRTDRMSVDDEERKLAQLVRLGALLPD
ncbi:MAG: 5-methyltetrahydropteroyltriglutamate--homocysteine S-methyltransferase [Burkholderiales bacterium]|nr:5-methyltetrahydropteroyltriglutamate--homocysteine S-methyltransferase [Burkholderiales bacterium]